jgi:hypothetical protein
MRIRSVVVGGMAGVIAMAMAGTSWGAGGVEGSIHDFSMSSMTNSSGFSYYGSWNSRHGVCSPCHAAHHTDPAQLAPLWTHESTVAPFTPYGSPTLQAAGVNGGTLGQPDKESLACLSCHDGTVAVNQLIGGTFTNVAAGGIFIDAGAQIGTDLHTTHPISFTYDAALATLDGGLENPTTYKIGDAKTKLTVQTAPKPATFSGTDLTGKTIDQAMLFGHKMQCSSCHDVHRLEGSSPSSGILARLSGTDPDGRGSVLCRTCHIK